MANGVPGLERIGPERLREIEPHTSGLAAIHSPATAIVDFSAVAMVMAERLREQETEILTEARVEGIARADGGLILETARGPVRARALINCAGLYADRVARILGARTTVRIIPFRGEYYHLTPERRHLVRGLIYPVPDPAFPFLGVHFTRTISGEVEAGPNAVLAFAREGYTYRDVRLGEIGKDAHLPRLLVYDMAPLANGALRVLPSLSKGGLRSSVTAPGPGGHRRRHRPGRRRRSRPGGREQRCPRRRLPHRRDARRGSTSSSAPSPAATASLAIGQHIADMAAKAFAT